MLKGGKTPIPLPSCFIELLERVLKNALDICGEITYRARDRTLLVVMCGDYIPSQGRDATGWDVERLHTVLQIYFSTRLLGESLQSDVIHICTGRKTESQSVPSYQTTVWFGIKSIWRLH